MNRIVKMLAGIRPFRPCSLIVLWPLLSPRAQQTTADAKASCADRLRATSARRKSTRLSGSSQPKKPSSVRP